MQRDKYLFGLHSSNYRFLLVGPGHSQVTTQQKMLSSGMWSSGWLILALFWFGFIFLSTVINTLKKKTAMNVGKYCISQSLIKMSLLYLHTANGSDAENLFCITQCRSIVCT